MTGRLKMAAPFVAWCALFLAVGVVAADLRTATARTEGRKRAAESGVKFIRLKAADVNQVSAVYDATANAHNEWLGAATSAIEQGSINQAVTDAASKAATAFVQWIGAKNRAVGEPVISAGDASKLEAATRQDLLDIANETVASRGSEAKRRSDTSALSARMRWKTWSEL